MKIQKLIGILVLFITISACGQRIKGNGQPTKESRTLNQSFSQIKVQQGIQVYLTQDPDVKLEVEADSNVIEHLKTEVKNGKLKIYFDEDVKKVRTKNVYLSAPEIVSIKASSGAGVKSENTIKSDNLSLDSSSGGNINLTVHSENLNCETSSGSVIKVRGDAENIDVDASSGSVIQCKELESKNCKADVSSGANIYVNVSNSFKGSASSGGYIKCKGDPEFKDKRTSSGGAIKF
ncbi:head GIN domain-containing protein [Aureivirga sp. CE67]|uniref:head GIN domain-containing protein n=1 Tax=Aureivirga sp. CE67 TaxID=1788983 RepID=UPI0018C9EF94|nr:head GIN domain-containing protein [Aureivirga sp. CE67]